MKIALVTPAPARSRAGNRNTALRWARVLRGLGHTVNVCTAYRGESIDLLIALHAWRSTASIQAFHQRWPDRPLIVAVIALTLEVRAHHHDVGGVVVLSIHTSHRTSRIFPTCSPESSIR